MSFSNGGNIAWTGTRSKGHKEKRITNGMRDSVKEAAQMLRATNEERDAILREFGRKLCDEYLSKNTLADGKNRHIPFSYGEVRFVIELINFTSKKDENEYQKFTPKEREMFDNSTFTVNDSSYFFGIKQDTRRK